MKKYNQTKVSKLLPVLMHSCASLFTHRDAAKTYELFIFNRLNFTRIIVLLLLINLNYSIPEQHTGTLQRSIMERSRYISRGKL